MASIIYPHFQISPLKGNPTSFKEHVSLQLWYANTGNILALQGIAQSLCLHHSHQRTIDIFRSFLFFRKKEREHASQVGQWEERDRIWSRLHVQNGAQHGAQSQDPVIMTWGEIVSWTLNQPSHPGALTRSELLMEDYSHTTWPQTPQNESSFMIRNKKIYLFFEEQNYMSWNLCEFKSQPKELNNLPHSIIPMLDL